MGLTSTRRILKLILKPKPVGAFKLMFIYFDFSMVQSFEITPSPPDPLFKLPQDRPDRVLWTTSPSSATRKSQSHGQEASFTVTNNLIFYHEHDVRFNDILADHCFPLLSRIRSNGYSQACPKSHQESAVHDTSPTPAPRHRLRRVRRQFSFKNHDHDFYVLNTKHTSDDKQFSDNIPFQFPTPFPETVLNPDQPLQETTLKHSSKDLSPITEDRETFASPGSLSTMFDSSMDPFAVSDSRSTGKLSTESSTNIPAETANYFTSQEPSFSSGQREIYPARSSPKLNSANHSTSTAQWSPVSPLVFADMSSFPGQPPNLDASHDIDLSDLSACKGNAIITFDSCARSSSNVSAAVTEKGGKRLRLDALDAQLSNKNPARNVDSRGCTSGISTANSIKAPIIDTVLSRPSVPRASPSKRIWSRLRRAVTVTFAKRSDITGVKDSGGREQSSRTTTQRMFAPLLISKASFVRNQDATRPRRRLTKPAHPATTSVVLDSKPSVSSPQKRTSKRSRLSNRTDIDFATIFSPSFALPE
ncbi:uncharacterized protein EDB93DRAFT_1152750 [Suillus bovinus]|uniref:uncharacterized protein n=1 Tax=Suillus bovinus TaxID=48563 RepID=UPI001B868C5B|nr:uncharacterized protein EDB93DRAFT_1152750 [Suillus bovinus]KAG2144688.1 hypothetical protein EDB93DRAFT_1152750 [Suillus bovinus]